MASTIKVDNVQNQPGTNIINKCSVTTTIGAGAGDTIKACAATVTLGRCGGTVALACGATQTGFGRTGTVDWITTPKVTGDSPVTGVTGKGYFLNTTAGQITINLPAGAAGSIVSLADYAATWQTNKVTVSPNGTDKIGGVNTTVDLSTEGQSVTLVYVDSTQGWINTMDSTSNVRASNEYNIQYLVVAGGGGGGTNYGGGGGAGGYRTVSSKTFAVNKTTGYPIVVGGGGAGPSGTPPASPIRGANGGVSTFSTICSAGGGGGSGFNGAGADGGSGGGGSAGTGPYSGAGAGNTPSTPCTQGYPGSDCASPGQAGGGGGASVKGGPGMPGGTGSSFTDLGPLAPSYGTSGPAPGRYFGGGGGAYPGGTGGSGGGGTYPAVGGINTGGGASSCVAGGSGIVIIRQVTAEGSPANAGGNATATCGVDTVRVFTSPGTFTA